MDNNELDKIIKEKLNGAIKPSKEFEQKIIQKIEEEKQKAKSAHIEEQEEVSKFTSKQNAENQDSSKLQKVNKIKNYNRFAKVLSMAAVILIVFTLGLNLKNTPLIENEPESNLISIKAIEPTKLESGVVAKDSEFTIFVEGDNVSAKAVQKSVYVEPALDYTIEKTLNKNEYKLKFKQNIPDNTIIKLQYVKNQITQDSWAYQTSNKFSVTSTYPDNKEESVTSKTIIDIEFSYATVKDLEKYVKISPTVKGTWEHLGRIWRFTPNQALEKGKKYTAVISKNLKAENQNLEDDYKFEFTIDDEDGVIAKCVSNSLDGIITSRANEIVRIPYYINNDNQQFGKVEIAKFVSMDDFIEYVDTANYSKAIKQGDYEVSKKVSDSHRSIVFKQTLTKGYYVAKVKSINGKELFHCPIQITDISAYAMETERDVLVWVAQNNNLASNVNVEYNGKTVKTDKQGIAKFENFLDGSKKVKYAKVGGELVIGVYNYSFENYPHAYIYTDRPLYKNTDTINIWGFVPKDFFYDKLEDEFYMELDEGDKQKISLQPDGTFTYKIDLKNHIDTEYTSVSLYYRDTLIGFKSVAIKNYELQNYTYEVSCNKNYGFIGDKINFDVKVKHITGLLVPNKNVVAIYEDKTYRSKTGEDGIAHFTISLRGEDSKDSSSRYQEVSIYNGDDVEYTGAEVFFGIRLLSKDVYVKEDYSTEQKYKATIYKLDTSKNVKPEYDLEELYNGIYETPIEVNLIENIVTLVQNGEELNEYTKQMEPHYDRVEDENKTKLKTIKSTNGVIEVDYNEFKQKQDTETQSYSYELEFIFKDTKGRNVRETSIIEKDWYNKEQFGYHTGFESEESYDRLGEISTDFGNDDYYTYRYLWDFDLGYPTKYTNGKKLEFKLQEATSTGRKDIENRGKVLNVFFKENISETEVLGANNFTREFTDNDFPGIKMTSAYFVDGKFYRMPDRYFDIDEDSKKVDVEITSDKETYKPGDEVTLTIKTTKNGKVVKSNVNVSVVNEAVFELVEDNTNILETIYTDKALAVYTYSSYYDDISSPDGGKGGGGGEPRGNFADTAHFETVNTDNNGTAKVKFKLPDNVTTYRVTAHSANKDLEVGIGTKKITSKLDFFVQSVEPRGIKVDDDLVLNATAIADKNYDVDYEFTLKELNKTLTAKGKTNSLVTANFGKLPIGTYTAVIKGKHGEQTDAIEYKVNVTKSSQEVKTKTTMNITSNAEIKPTKNPIVLEIYNKNMEKYVKYIDFVESIVTERLDTQIAYNKIQDVKNKYYDTSDVSSINRVNMDIYTGKEKGLKNLRSGKDDIVLTAMVTYYAREYGTNIRFNELSKNDNIFEYYLWLAAKQEPVLQDLIYLKEEKDISNYNKLLVTLSFEFMGDYKNAKELYSRISLSSEEAKQYKSIIATIETFINKKEAVQKIDNLIKNSPADEYLRFAILSFFQNNSEEIGNEETVVVKMNGKQKTLKVNGVQIQKLLINNEELANITFETDSQDLMVSYYYRTGLEEISDKNIAKDIKISLNSKGQVGSTVNLKVEFSGNYEGEVRIALPNSLRLSKVEKTLSGDDKYYVQNNMINYITIYKTKKCKTINLPLVVTNPGIYKFENIVCNVEGKYHISNSVGFEIK